jgi:hypothetical protein
MGARISMVACHFGIPKTSSNNHVNGKTNFWKCGKDATLFAKEEERIVNWLLKMQQIGLFMSI